jgi:uncharacterized membrane-anchored protein YitT (DUF2179 family)
LPLQYFTAHIKNLFAADRSRTTASIQRRRSVRRFRTRLLNELGDAFLILLGIISAGFGLKSFIIPAGFVDGGVMGISLLASRETAISLSILIIVFNIPFLLLGWRQISRWFSIKSIIAIVVLAIVINLVPYPVLTDDKILAAVFGGFSLGTGIGLAIRGGAVIDGTEILAIYLNRRTSLSVGDFIMIFNILIFCAAAYLLTIETALYSVLTYMAASKMVDFILEGIEEFTGVTIISAKSRQITEMIQNKLGRGLTIYTGKKGFGKRGESSNTSDIIFTVITRLEINRLTDEIELIDRNAFIVMQSIKDTKGGMVKKLPLKKIKTPLKD